MSQLDVREALRGSAMSTRQIAYAAYHGRRVHFEGLPGVPPLTGYVIGMDDFHWLLATMDRCNGEQTVATVLVHKGSAPLTYIAREGTLDKEDPAVLAQVLAIGGAFFQWCGEKYCQAPALSSEVQE